MTLGFLPKRLGLAVTCSKSLHASFKVEYITTYSRGGRLYENSLARAHAQALANQYIYLSFITRYKLDTYTRSKTEVMTVGRWFSCCLGFGSYLSVTCGLGTHALEEEVVKGRRES